MNRSQVEKAIDSILPNRSHDPGSARPDKERRAQAIANIATSVISKANAKELAKARYKAARQLKQDQYNKEKAAAAQAKLDAIDAIEEATVLPADISSITKQAQAIAAASSASTSTQPASPASPAPTPTILSPALYNKALQLQGTTRPEIAKLLTALNINLSVQLSKSDTANLLACLLTCNEQQLTALTKNKRIPLAIKTIIKRLQDDARIGAIDTIEKIWDRVFGKGPLQLDLPQQTSTGIIPNTPVSREAYILIRESIMS